MSIIPEVELRPRVAFSRQQEALAGRTDDISFIRLSSVIIAVMMFLAYALSRIGMSDSLNILPLLLSVTILLLPELVSVRSWSDTVLVQLVVILLFFGLGWVSILFTIDLSVILYVTFLFTLLVLIRSRKLKWGQYGVVKLLMVLVFGFELIALVWTQDYMNPMAPEAYSVGRRFVHVDTLFLSAMTSNIKNYQVAGTGLFGLVPFPYHSGSNYLFASYAQLCKTSVLQFYNLAFPVIFVPLFFQSLLVASLSTTRSKYSNIRMIACLVTFFFVLAGFFPSEISNRFLLPTGLNFHFISQSYCLSLILGFFAITIYSPLLRKDSLHISRGLNALLFLCLPVFVFLIGYSKLSTAVVLLAVLSYLFLRRGLIIRPLVFVSWLLSVLTLYYVLTISFLPNENTFIIQWGSYYSMYVKDSLFIYFLLHYTFFILLFAALFFILRKRQKRFIDDVLSGKFLVIELILVAACVGIIPGLMIHIEGGSAFYFSDIQYWLTAVSLIGVAPYFAFRYHNRFKSFPKMFALVAIVLVFVMVRESVFRSFYYFAKKNLRIRTNLVYGAEALNARPELNASFVRAITFGIEDSPLFHEQVGKLNLTLFSSLRELPAEVRKTAVIYVKDPDYLETFLTCSEATFYVPAMSELAMINGLYWAEECYQIGAYGMRAYPSAPGSISKADALDLARSKGFAHMITINLKEGSYVIEKL